MKMNTEKLKELNAPFDTIDWDTSDRPDHMIWLLVRLGRLTGLELAYEFVHRVIAADTTGELEEIGIMDRMRAAQLSHAKGPISGDTGAANTVMLVCRLSMHIADEHEWLLARIRELVPECPEF